MSHFTEVKTKITNVNALKKALRRCGYTVEEATEGVEVRGFFGESVKADFKILTKSNYDVGFKKNVDGSIELVGDWELLPKVSGIEKESFTQYVKKEYARQTILDIAQEKGFEVETQENEGGIELVLTQW